MKLKMIKHIAFTVLFLLGMVSVASAAPCTGQIYVDGDNGSPSSPYSSWATAATDISTALAVASSGDKVCVRASTATYGGFTPVDGVTVTAEFCDPQGTITRPVVGTIDFNGDYTSSPNQTIVECMDTSNASTGVYISASTAPDGIDNNTILRYNWITSSGVTEPGLRHENGSPVIEDNTFTGAEGPGIRIYQSAGGSSEAMIIRGNTMYNDSSACNAQYCSEIYFDTYTSSNRYVLIQDNIIYDTDTTARAGINFGAGTNNAYITGNQIFDVNYAGIHVSEAQNTSTKIIISGETSFTFAGTAYTDGSPNEIYSNGRGGITTEDTVIMDIISNDIHDNDWGGISTDKIDTDGTTYLGFSGPWGTAVLDIRKNYIHGNGAALNTIGGGINVRMAEASITNNVIYQNNRAGIRVGDYVTEISNNTVVSNGNATDDMGGGIVYDSTANSVLDAMPSGTLASAIPVKNNIIAYTEKAALMGLGFTNTAAFERNYNLLYDNNPGAFFMTPDCGYVAGTLDFKCVGGQYGILSALITYRDLGNANCIASLDPYPCCDGYQSGTCTGDGKTHLSDPNDRLGDPVFMSTTTGSEDYQLDTGSAGIGTGEGGTDMGAWGGPDFMDWSHGLPH